MTEIYDPNRGHIKVTLADGPQKGREVFVHATEYRRRMSVQRPNSDKVDEYRVDNHDGLVAEAHFFCWPHDWRVDPTLILRSNPPRRRVVCANCGEISSIAAEKGKVPLRHDVSTWEKAPEGSVKEL